MRRLVSPYIETAELGRALVRSGRPISGEKMRRIGSRMARRFYRAYRRIERDWYLETGLAELGEAGA